MDSALEYLFMRRPSIDYISPAICEAAFSSSSGPVIVLNALDHLLSITGIVFGSTGHPHRLAWNRYPGALCYSVYKLVDELDPNGAYQLIAECIGDEFFDLEDEGTYKITAITPDGETPFGDPITITFETPVTASIELVEMDNAYDLADEAKVVAGDKNTFAAFYKDGSVVESHVGGETFGFYQAVSPNGKWVVGDIGDAGFVDQLVTYDTSTATFRSVRNNDFGMDVTNDGTVFSFRNRLVHPVTGASLADIPAAFPAHAVQHDSEGGNLNNNLQVAIRDITGNKDFKWQSGVGMQIDPSDFSGIFNGGKIRVNELGHFAAQYVNNVAQNRTLFYNGVTSVAIGDFGGFVTMFGIAPNADWVVGQADNGSSFYGAFRWSPLTGLEMLPLIPTMTPGSSGIAFDANDAGWIVGTMDDKAFLYKEGASLELINYVPGGTDWTSLESALFINNLKQVVGKGTKNGVPNQLYILQLV